VASLSKPVTALAVLLLVEDGQLDLDRPVWDYLGSWRPPPSSHDTSKVTARLLLSHRAGIGVHGYPGYAPGRALPSLLESLDGRNGGAGAATLVAEPGTQVLYSSGGYVVLQLLVEEITGEPFASFAERRVLAPLAMTRSSFAPREPQRAAAGHGWWGGRLPAFRFTEQAATGLSAPAGDLARFLTVLSSPSAQASVGVSPATLERMLAAPDDGGFALGFAIDPTASRTPSGDSVPGTPIRWHNGSSRGFRAVLGAAPARGDGVVVLTNSDRGLAMTDDLYCSWVRWETGLDSASCWAESRRRGTMVAVAALLGLGVLMDAAAFVRRTTARRRNAGERHAWAGAARLAIAIALLAGWWLYWYTDRVARWREGIAHFVPASSQPPTFFWLTAVVTVWCLLGVARFAASRGAV
jgi:CubicO group peptidase (beta-lactamase class C family)